MSRNRRQILAAIGIAIGGVLVCAILLERQITRRRNFHERLSTVGDLYQPPIPHAWMQRIRSYCGTTAAESLEELGRPVYLRQSPFAKEILDEDLRLAVEYSENWEGLIFASSSLTSHQLDLLTPCKRADYIYVSRTQLDQAAIPTLRSFTALKYLLVEDLPFGDSEIATLAELPRLQNLFTSRCPITREVVPALARSRTLRKWYTDGCPQLLLTPADFLALRQLEVVYVSEATVVDLDQSRAMIAKAGSQLRIIIDQPQPEIEIPEGNDSKDLAF